MPNLPVFLEVLVRGRLQVFFDDIMGPQREFSLRDRVVNAGTFSATMISASITVADTLQGIGLVSSVFTFVLAGIFGLLYFMGRRRPQSKYIIIPFFIIGLLAIFYDWRFFYGLRGTSLLIATTVAVVIPVVLSGFKKFVALGLLFSLLIILYFYELNLQDSIANYPSRQSHITDLLVTYLLLATGITLLVSLVIKGYNDQRHQNKKLNKALVQTNDRLRESIGTKDRFFSIISHDLRGPVGSLSHLGDILASNFDELSSDERKELVDSIQKSSEMAFSLLDNLLNWALNETGELKPRPEPLILRELIEENISLLSSSAAAKDINLQCSNHQDTLISADREMVKLVIRNLISNAIKFTEEGGEIHIGIDGPEKGMLRFYVRDNGVGISDERIASLFKSETYSTYGTSSEKGTGIGLKLCKLLVEKNKGIISLTSTEGQGSTFTVSFPTQGT